MNQIVVDISNQVTALRQAHSRYTVARDTRELQEQLLEKEQQSFQLGTSSINNVITAQRTVANAETTEIAARSTYNRARLSLDAVLGETLEKNHVSATGALRMAP
jgi:outer membrane protein TolC